MRFMISTYFVLYFMKSKKTNSSNEKKNSKDATKTNETFQHNYLHGKLADR